MPRSSTSSAANTRKATCSASRWSRSARSRWSAGRTPKHRGRSRRASVLLSPLPLAGEGRRRRRRGEGLCEFGKTSLPARERAPTSPRFAGRGEEEKSGVSGLARQLAEIDADLAHRFFVFGVDVLAEDQFRIGIAIEPAVLCDLVFQLTGRPARIAERQHCALR